MSFSIITGDFSRLQLYFFCGNLSLSIHLPNTFFTFAAQKYPTNYDMEQQQSSYKERERIDLREPRRFKVTIFNDDFTTMEFVVKILTTVFFKSMIEAETLMMQVHKTESAVVGVYTYDIAQSKVQKATRMAREKDFPLRLTVSPEEE